MAFEFDRYINGTLMAEGVIIERQKNLADAMREAARIASRGPNGEMPVLVLRAEAAERALAERAGGAKGEWHRADGDKSILLYTLRQDGWRKGEAVMVNDVTVRIEAAHGSETPIEPIASAILATLTTEPAAPEGRQEAGRIGDAVLDWMVKFDLLDAGNEYYVSDVLAVLNDLTPSTRPAEQAVTEAARSVLEWYERDGSVGGAVEPFEALKAAMEAGRHD